MGNKGGRRKLKQPFQSAPSFLDTYLPPPPATPKPESLTHLSTTEVAFASISRCSWSALKGGSACVVWEPTTLPTRACRGLVTWEGAASRRSVAAASILLLLLLLGLDLIAPLKLVVLVLLLLLELLLMA